MSYLFITSMQQRQSFIDVPPTLPCNNFDHLLICSFLGTTIIYLILFVSPEFRYFHAMILTNYGFVNASIQRLPVFINFPLFIGVTIIDSFRNSTFQWFLLFYLLISSYIIHATNYVHGQVIFLFFIARKIHLSILLEKCTYRKQKETFHLTYPCMDR